MLIKEEKGEKTRKRVQFNNFIKKYLICGEYITVEYKSTERTEW